MLTLTNQLSGALPLIASGGVRSIPSVPESSLVTVDLLIASNAAEKIIDPVTVQEPTIGLKRIWRVVPMGSGSVWTPRIAQNVRDPSRRIKVVITWNACIQVVDMNSAGYALLICQDILIRDLAISIVLMKKPNWVKTKPKRLRKILRSTLGIMRDIKTINRLLNLQEISWRSLMLIQSNWPLIYSFLTSSLNSWKRPVRFSFRLKLISSGPMLTDTSWMTLSRETCTRLFKKSLILSQESFTLSLRSSTMKLERI